MEKGVRKQGVEVESQKKNKATVSSSKGEVLKSRADSCAKCGKRVIANSMMCSKCGKWVHGTCAKMKRVTSTHAKGFICELCVDTMEGIVEPGEEISFVDQVDLVKSFYWGDKLMLVVEVKQQKEQEQELDG